MEVRRVRNENIMIKVTKEEKKQIQALAFAADLSVSNYCRKVLLSMPKRKEATELVGAV